MGVEESANDVAFKTGVTYNLEMCCFSNKINDFCGFSV